jgi:hypothetical protein
VKPLKPTRGEPRPAAVLGRGDLGASLLYIFPLFLFYEIGVAFSPMVNGVDFISRNLYALVNYDRVTYLLVHGGMALVFLGILWAVRRTKALPRGRFLPMLLESTIYALTLGTLIIFVMQRILGIDPRLAAGEVQGSALLMSIGAGVHEELVFRLGACAGGAALLRLFGLRHAVAVAIAFAVSSLLFSAAHHVGAHGDPFTLDVFVYRALAGVLFAAIFYWRSLAHAVYTHALYDVYVMVLRPLFIG